jgi:hypothetical protein
MPESRVPRAVAQMFAAAADYDDGSGLRCFVALLVTGVADWRVEHWLGLLRLAWGGQYVICFDDIAHIAWMAWRRDDERVMLCGRTPQELNAAIRAERPREEIR